MKRRRFRDDRPKPQRPANPRPEIFDWAPLLEIALGPAPERRPLLFEIVVSQPGQEPTS
jgi:hypothetical protein